MRKRFLPSALLSAALLVVSAPRLASAAMQELALFPPKAEGVSGVPDLSRRMGTLLQEKLKDRFDVALVETAGEQKTEDRIRKARALGATYLLIGSLVRIGRSVTLDLMISPTEGAGTGRTVVATASDGEMEGTNTGEGEKGELPFVYRRLAIEAAAKLKLLFFGDGMVGEGTGKKRIPGLTGSVSRSRSIPGDVVSIARGDTDRDGKEEIVAAYRNAIVVYRTEGQDLAEKARIPVSGDGMLHLDVADLNRNGIAEILAVRYIAGRAFSEILEFDGKEYRRIAADLPYFLRVVDLGEEGVVLVGQESDPAAIFSGPVFRIAVDRYGLGETRERKEPLPLPEGTWIYSFVPLKQGNTIRYAAVGGGNRLRLFDRMGRKLWEGIDSVSGTETFLEAPVASGIAPSGQPLHRRLHLPGRLLAADLDGDRSDELLLANNIVRAGAFFENLRLYSNAELLCFAQAGEGLELAWRSAQIGSSAHDLFLERSAGKGISRMGIASPDSGKILGRFGEWRLLWVR